MRPAPVPLRDKFVDLGLPSGNLWGKYNVGADSEVGFGLFYSWGNIEGHELNDGYSFSEEDYNLTPAASLDHDIVAGGPNDAAHAYYGSNAQMPARADFAELLNTNYCSHEHIVNYQGSGVEGFLFTSTANGKTLFLPCAGYIENMIHHNVDPKNGSYWAANIDEQNAGNAAYLRFYATVIEVSNIDRTRGRTIRAIIKNL